jgi:hypothetical protein
MPARIFYFIFILTIGAFKSYGNGVDSLNSSKQKIAISGNFGSYGAGVCLHYLPYERVGLKIGYFRGDLNATYFTNFEGNKIEVIGKFHLEMLTILADIYPWKKKIFRITTGIAKNSNRYEVKLTPQSNQTFGYIVYTPDLIGNMKATVTGLQYAPYLGMGFDKTVPKHKIGIGLDIGAFYHGPPKFKIDATGSFEPSGNTENTQVLERAFRNWQIFPFINLQLKYRIQP